MRRYFAAIWSRASEVAPMLPTFALAAPVVLSLLDIPSETSKSLVTECPQFEGRVLFDIGGMHTFGPASLLLKLFDIEGTPIIGARLP